MTMKRIEEFNLVREVIERYVQGTRTGNVEILKQVFHPNAVMSGYLGPDLLIGSTQPFYDHVTSNPVESEYVAEPSEIINRHTKTFSIQVLIAAVKDLRVMRDVLDIKAAN